MPSQPQESNLQLLIFRLRNQSEFQNHGPSPDVLGPHDSSIRFLHLETRESSLGVARYQNYARPENYASVCRWQTSSTPRGPRRQPAPLVPGG
jgi:hypothetical protein